MHIQEVVPVAPRARAARARGMSDAAHEAMIRVLLTHLRRKQRVGLQFDRWGHRILIEVDGRFRILEIARAPSEVLTTIDRCRVYGLDAAFRQLHAWGIDRRSNRHGA